MTNWFSRNQHLIIKFAFLIPIISVAAISISHVVSWYDLANPTSWAIYLSIAIEIAAMSAIAAAAVKVRGFSVWFVFIIVTFIQFIGNIYFSYTEIDETSKFFTQWVELTLPVMDSLGVDITNVASQKRVLALLEGGLLPLISLTCLHFFIKYEGKDAISIAKEIEDLQEELKEEIEEDEAIQEQLEEQLEEQLISNEEESNELIEIVIDSQPLNEPQQVSKQTVDSPPLTGRGTFSEDYRKNTKKPATLSEKMKRFTR